MISIIVPIYNVERFLSECVDSILNQTYKDFELILVDDGSTDSSLSICKSYQAFDQRVKVITKENGGQMSAWILGVKESVGEFIGFVDSDDFIDPDMYQEMLSTQRMYNADVVMCGRMAFDRIHKKTPKKTPGINYNALYTGENIDEIYSMVFPSLHNCISQARWDKLFKRDIFIDNMNKYCTKCVRTMEDRFIVSSVLLSAKIVAFINKPLYHWRAVNNSSSRKPRLELYDIAELLYETQKQMLEDKGLYDKYKKNLELSRLDYLNMICIRNIARKNGLSLRQKLQISKKMLNDSNYSNTVLNNKKDCVGKFGKFLLLSYQLKSAFFFTIALILYGLFVEKENTNGF